MKQIKPLNQVNKAESNKDKVLKFLGGDNPKALFAIINNHLEGDKFAENSSCIFGHIIKYQNENDLESFAKACNQFAEDKLQYNYSR